MLNESELIEHNSRDLRYRSPFGAIEAGKTLRLGLFARLDEKINSASLRLWTNDEEKIIPLLEEEAGFFASEISPNEKGLVWYYFIIETATRKIFYGNNKNSLGGIGAVSESEPASYQITVFEQGAKTPDWLKNSVMYQIFPDRFYREGNELPARKGALFHTDWNDTPYYFFDRATGDILAYDFFGGNLAGIKKKLPYLKELGISLIYLNPVFEAESNHRYDTGDYKKIDPFLGTEEDFKELIEEAKRAGIKIIIDGVFSHTGSNSRYFNAKGEYESLGAAQSENSPYYPWYKFTKYPDKYESWWGVTTLPEVNETEKSYLDFIIHDEDSVLHKWLDAGISGWRLDVLDELPEKFLRPLYAELKKCDEDAILIGEVWEDASNKISYGEQREYLCGGETDGIMNYPLRTAMLDFFLKRSSGEEIESRLESLRENYPKENFYALMNMLGTHDVERIMTVLGEGVQSETLPSIERAKLKLDEKMRKVATERLKAAVLWQMTYPGVPSVYYGDEIGAEGQRDPFNRRTYDWEGGDAELREFFKGAIALRNNSAALRTGEFIPLKGEGDIYAYARVISGGRDAFAHEAKDEAFVVVVNRGDEIKEVSLFVGEFCASGETLCDCFDESAKFFVGAGDSLHVELKPRSTRVLRLDDERKYSRESGILLHPTALPSRFGVGDIGKSALAFLDFLKSAGQSVWQFLPLHPVDASGSPYQSPSAFAFNPLLIDLEGVFDDGLLTFDELKAAQAESERVDFAPVREKKTKALKIAFSRAGKLAEEISEYFEREKAWLDDYALFCALKEKFSALPWTKWQEKIKRRDIAELDKARKELKDEIAYYVFEQFVFDRQWQKLHAYAKKLGIKIFGDIPLFLAHDSADVWAHPELFALDEAGEPLLVAGVPPDYFSETGQLWGNPQYDWAAMKEDDFAWWTDRLKHLFAYVDIVRIDHFRGLESYWEIPADAKTAKEGRWVKGVGEELFVSLKKKLGDLPLVAEDLGILTDEVCRLRDENDFPGMRVLEFELLSGKPGFLTAENSVAYTGTHDNNTLRGWYEEDLSESERRRVASFFGTKDENEILNAILETVAASKAKLSIYPLTDVLLLASDARFNTPGTTQGNWSYRLKMLPDEKIAEKLKKMGIKYQR